MKKELKNSIDKIKKPFMHVKKIKHIVWLLPGWAFYEFYKLSKNKGEKRSKSLKHGAKAEIIRLVATASLPIPGTYELTTTGLALLKRKIEKGEIENLTLKFFRDFIPLYLDKKALRKNTFIVPERKPYVKIFEKGKKLYFRIFYGKNE